MPLTNKFCTKSKTNRSPIKKERTEKTEIFPLSKRKSAIKNTTTETIGAKKSATNVTIKLFFIDVEKSEKMLKSAPAIIPKQMKTTAWKKVPAKHTI